MLLVHAGNRIDSADRVEPRFPPDQVDAVATDVARLLHELAPSAVISAPANGADLIVLCEAQRLSIPTHVVLPLPEIEFQRRSVETSDGDWVERYHRVLHAARTTPGSTVEVTDLSPDPQWYRTAQQLLIDRARTVADGVEAIVALTVRPNADEAPPSATDDFARLAHAAGFEVLSIDPRPVDRRGAAPSDGGR